ncbi:MAG: hypothetical protein JXA44_13265 [Methanospirillaceae archaeon]|nr:hypothetical protein [Methanospirillaceae archaeon]
MNNMSSSLLDEYHTLNTIIEQDKRVSSFKYALLRAAIEICQQYDHLEEQKGDRVWYPIGLLIERWIFYYFPIFASDVFIPQLNGEKDLDYEKKHISFRSPLSDIIKNYSRQGGGITEFYADYRKGTIPDDLQETMRDLIRKMRKAIIEGPFEHLGQSQSGTKDAKFLVFDWDHERFRLPISPVNPEYLILHCGTFSFSKNLADLFKYFGSFILGEGSILNKWAQFTTQIGKAQGLSISREQMLQVLSSSPNTERQVHLATQFYRDLLNRTGEVCCVWSGYPIRSDSDLHIDHPASLFTLEKQRSLESHACTG